MNWAKVVQVLVLIYKAVLSGKTVNIGGTPITLPDQRPTVPVR